MADQDRLVSFRLGGINFEYDEVKNQINLKKHGIPFKYAAYIFFDYDRIELYDDSHSSDEDRYDTIGRVSAGTRTIIGHMKPFKGQTNDILFVVYTERTVIGMDGRSTDSIRFISARLATGFERGLYYGKYQ